MKRTLVIDIFITLVLLLAINVFVVNAIQKSSIVYLIFAAIAGVAIMVSIFCICEESNYEK